MHETDGTTAPRPEKATQSPDLADSVTALPRELQLRVLRLIDELEAEGPITCTDCGLLLPGVEAWAIHQRRHGREIGDFDPLVQEGRDLLADILPVAIDLLGLCGRWAAHKVAVEALLTALAGGEDDVRWDLYECLPEHAIGHVLGGLAARIDTLNGGTAAEELTISELLSTAGGWGIDMEAR